MSHEPLICRDEGRRNTVRSEHLNGLDYLEVSDNPKILNVCFLGKAPQSIEPANVRIEGGVRVRDINVSNVSVCRSTDPTLDDYMEVRVDRPGDFSTYILRLVALDDGRPTDRPMDGFDPRYDRLCFSFKAHCPSELDCKTAPVCAAPGYEEPQIDYLAKDYGSFRQLMLDRMARIMPDWTDRHVPDLGMALVETLAYVGDHLSYYQDAVATEAYLDTARRRISVRRHARLVDYAMHEGTNARAWVTLRVSPGNVTRELTDFYLITDYDGAPQPGTILRREELPDARPFPFEVFEPVAIQGTDSVTFYEAHNEIRFYTWGDRQCCLLKGATRATLIDPGPIQAAADAFQVDPTQECSGPVDSKLTVSDSEPSSAYRRSLDKGDFLVFEEVKGPKTGNPADADPSHRHVVRLTDVRYGFDTLPKEPEPIVEIAWAAEDALPFPLCISSLRTADVGDACSLVENVSVARGNVLLVDHGRRVPDEGAEDLDEVPEGKTRFECEGEGRPVVAETQPASFRPTLEHGPLVHSAPLARGAPASDLLEQNPRRAAPWIRLTSSHPAPGGAAGLKTEWHPRRDFLASGGRDPHFVAELDEERRAHLRFGDDELGKRPEAGSRFEAVYRVGDPSAGNVGPGAIAYVVLRQGVLDGLSLAARNPLPARGGTAPELLSTARNMAPHAHRIDLQRAVTADDYARLAERHPKVQRAAARLRWSGCSYLVLVAIDPLGGEEADAKLLGELDRFLFRYRRIGHRVVVASARYVPLKVELTICVKPDFLRAHVEIALLERLGNRTLPDGTRGFFHPDNLTFGEGVYLSGLVAATQRVAGVENVGVREFQRKFAVASDEIEKGVLKLGPFEIARLDDDRNNPENGTLSLDMRGGR